MTCRRCKKQYVGKTEQTLKQRHYGHRREIEIASTPLGKHFAQGCGYTNWSMQVRKEGSRMIKDIFVFGRRMITLNTKAFHSTAIFVTCQVICYI